ncbi:MAG: aminotransferase class V-fold PLP-dependent enzyme, partial [Phaeodactylibacter sp.]|nr:aminotransferase class V-fold PLP-dependent enzyme [Phaeodactylibacter sp.]
MKNQREAFSLHPEVHYLNNAYKAPLLRAAETAAMEALVQARNPQAIDPSAFFSTTAEVQALFAQLVNCAASEVVIIPSVSYGIGSVLANLPYQAGQHALTVEEEFPSDYFALQRWCTQHQAPLRIIGPDASAQQKGAGWHERLLAAIQPETAVLVISSVHWVNGLKFDLEAIGKRCMETGTKLIVDGTQSVGALPIDVQKYHIDALICADYKWLLGPYS